eukprot:CAMPEP_0185374732 /NCGR_PEP_ID=MMETSP1364-20130426/34105_1 /TAXON_ID=38817 /ORGANISM="Gephyrocapsa oceanica, Strain RCC1303" /LENGTH=72 /DNA_ID=CAMNT_0027975955 /DNA_START=82 /DNA_END=296 /DNA_ORIENTATION=+
MFNPNELCRALARTGEIRARNGRLQSAQAEFKAHGETSDGRPEGKKSCTGKCGGTEPDVSCNGLANGCGCSA